MRIANILIFLTYFCLQSFANEQTDPFIYGKFPDNFQWGFATASYQIEGAFKADGKGENIWDEFVHRVPSPIRDNSTGDIACNSYYKYEEDIQLLKNIGAQIYRFSLSWSRLLPTGFYKSEADVNPLGVEYYNKVINLLIQNNIKPMVTLYHWDLPQPLQEAGGWPDNTDLPEHFANYSRLAFEKFGDRVTEWLTFNEPFVVCVEGHSTGEMAPGIKDPPTAPYKCGHTILKSHALAYQVYNQEFRSSQNGRVGITLDSGWYEPEDPNNESHREAAEIAQQFKHGWFGSPIFFGNYPQKMIDLVAANSPVGQSRLPVFNAAWQQLLKGSWDYLGLNHYTTNMIRPRVDTDPEVELGWFGDQGTFTYFHEDWPESAAEWLRPVPWGFRKLLKWLKNTYGNPEIIITENGYADTPADGINDNGRVDYFNQYINNMLKAVNEDGVNVTGYTAWSLLDNFEWHRGFTQRYGIHHVDFEDENRPRTMKKSAHFLKELYAYNGFKSISSQLSNSFVLLFLLVITTMLFSVLKF